MDLFVLLALLDLEAALIRLISGEFYFRALQLGLHAPHMPAC
jgi:hypothetical protein